MDQPRLTRLVQDTAEVIEVVMTTLEDDRNEGRDTYIRRGTRATSRICPGHVRRVYSSARRAPTSRRFSSAMG